MGYAYLPTPLGVCSGASGSINAPEQNYARWTEGIPPNSTGQLPQNITHGPKGIPFQSRVPQAIFMQLSTTMCTICFGG